MNRDRISIAKEEQEEVLRQYIKEDIKSATEGIFINSNWLQQSENPFGKRYLTPEENRRKQEMYRKMSEEVKEEELREEEEAARVAICDGCIMAAVSCLI